MYLFACHKSCHKVPTCPDILEPLEPSRDKAEQKSEEQQADQNADFHLKQVIHFKI